MKLEEVQHKLLLEIQSLPSEVALESCNKALREIYREYDWSFLYKRGYIKTPALINTGTANVVKYSNEVTLSTAARAIIDAIVIGDVPIENRQFRTLSGRIAGSNFIYDIISYDTLTGKIVISPEYQDETNTTARFQIFKNKYTAPNLVIKDSNDNIIFDGIDFAEFEFIYAPFDNRRLRLDMSRSELDSRDGSRTSMGDARHIVPYGSDSANNRLFELYPIPTVERVYQVLYKILGRDLEPEEDIPTTLSSDLVIAKAKIKAFEWLAINGEKVGDKRSPNMFMNLIAMISNPLMENSYYKLLEEAKRKDDNLYPQSLITMGNSYPYYDNVIVETVLMDF